MAIDIASLVISIDSTSAGKAADNLGKVSDAGDKAEGAAGRVKRAWDETNGVMRKVSGDTGQMVTAFDRLNTTQTEMLAQITRATAALESMQRMERQVTQHTQEVSQAAIVAAAGIDSMAKATDAAAAADKRLVEAEEQATSRIKAMVAASVQKTAEMNRATQASLAASTAAAELARTEAAGAASSGQAGAARRAALASQMQGFQQVANEIAEVNRALGSIGKGSGSMEKIQADTSRLVTLWEQGRISVDQFDAAIKRLDADEKRLVDTQAKATAAADQFIAKLKQEAETAGMTRRQLLDYQAAKLGVSAQAGPFLAKIDASTAGLSRFGAGSKQAQQQLMVLGREIATGSWSGLGSSLSVMAQETGLLTKAFSPLGLAIGGAAVTLGLFAVAAIQGQEEVAKLNRAVVVTGGMAGNSGGQLLQMAERIGQVNHNADDASGVLLALARSGSVSGRVIESVGQAATNMAKLTGDGAEKTGAYFAKMSDGVAKFAEDFNSKYHMLDTAILEQIRSLEKHGQSEEAQELLAKQIAQEAQTRIETLRNSLNDGQRAWEDLGNAATTAWRKMKAAANVALNAESIQQELDWRKQWEGGERTTGTFFGSLRDAVTGQPSNASRIAELQAKADKLAADAEEEGRRAAAQAREDSASQGWTSALKSAKADAAKADEILALSVRTRVLMEAQSSRQKANPDYIDPRLVDVTSKADGTFSGGQYETQLADINKRYDGGATAKAASAAQNALQGQIAAIQALSKVADDALKATMDHEKALLDAGEINKRDYYAHTYDAQAEALQKQLGLAKQEETLAKGLNSQAAREAAAGKVVKLQQDVVQNAQKYADELAKIDGEVKKGIDEQIAKWKESETSAQLSLDSENALFGKSGDARALAAIQMKAEAEARERLLALAKTNGPISDAETKRINEAAKAHGEAAKQIEANTLAAQGAQTLLDENKRFAADSIIDEQERAAAILEIDNQMWRDRIAAAEAGSQGRERLEEQYAIRIANQAAKPSIDLAKANRKDYENGWNQTIQNMNTVFTDGLADMLNRGEGTWEAFTKSIGTSFKTAVADMLYKEFAKPIVVSVLANMAGFLTGNSSTTNSILAANGGGSSWINNLSTANSGANYINAGIQAAGGYSTGASTASLAYANGVGAIGGDSLGALISANGGWAGVGMGAGLSAGVGSTFAGLAATNAATGAVATGLGTGAFGAGLGTGAVSGLGSVTGAALGAAAPGAIATGTGIGTVVGGTSIAVTGTGAVGAAGGAALGATAGAGATAGSMAAAAIPYIGWAIAAMAVLSTMIGSDKTPAVAGNGLATIDAEGSIAQDGREKFYGDDRGYTGSSMSNGLASYGDQIQAAAKLYGGDASGLQIYAQTAYSPDEQGASGGTALYDKDGTQFFGSSFEGTNEELDANLQLSMSRAILGALQHADLAPEFKKVFEGYGDNLGTLTAEQVASINATLDAVRAMNAAFDGMAITFPELEKLGWEARTALTSFSGGLEALNANLASYYGTYYSEAERMGDTLAAMTKTFDELGLAVPGTKDEFKTLVESLDLTTESGQKAYATLLGMNQTFAGWADYAATQASAAREMDVAFDSLAATFPALASLSREAREAILGLGGGLDALKSNLSSYSEGYYSDSERMVATTMSLGKVFAGLDVAMPATREGFRDLVESLDLTTTSGQKTFATLISVSDSFGSMADRIAAIVTAARDTAETAASGAMTALTNSVNVQKDALTKAWQDQQEAMQTSIDAASTAVSNLKSLSDRVKSTLNTMFGQTDAAMQRSQAQAQISGALATARAGGGLPDVATLENAFSVVAQPSQALFATFEDYQLDFLKAANDIAALGALTDSQLSIEERTLQALKDDLKAGQEEYERQIDYYDSMLTTAQAQLDAAMGNTAATLTVAEAMAQLNASVLALAGLNASKPASSGATGVLGDLTKNEQVVYDAYKGSGIGNLDAEGFKFWTDALNNGANPDAIAAQIAAINQAKADGSHANGLWSVPFDEYNAILHKDETVLPAPEARAYRALQSAPRNGGGDTARLEALVEALTDEVQGLRIEARATATATAKTVKALDRVMPDGASLSVTVKEVAAA